LRWILYWQAREKLEHDLSIAIQLRDATGQVRLTHDQAPSTPYLETDQFPVGVTLRGLTQVTLPRDLEPGVYDIHVLVWDKTAQRNLDLLNAEGRPLGIAVPLGRVDVTPAMQAK
jgi:hypothetical protein